MLREVGDRVRELVDQALSSARGDRYRPLRLLREVLGTANDLAGRPFCSREELVRRRVRPGGATDVKTPPPASPRPEAVPVQIYFDGRDHRALRDVEQLLGTRKIPYAVLDVGEDEAGRSWAELQAKGRELPLVVIDGDPVGGLPELVRLDEEGLLSPRVFG